MLRVGFPVTVVGEVANEEIGGLRVVLANGPLIRGGLLVVDTGVDCGSGTTERETLTVVVVVIAVVVVWAWH